MVIAEACERFNVIVYSACQMGNHYHLVLETPRGNISEALQFINGEHAKTTNQRHGRTGHSYEARFHSQIVEREQYLRKVNRYVVLNPVQARMVRAPEDWNWSSYRATAGLEAPPAWLNIDWIVWAFDAATLEEAQARYKAYVHEHNALKVRFSSRAIALGPRAFRKAMAQALDDLKENRRVPTVPRLAERVDLATLFDPANGVSQDEAALTAHLKHGYCITEIASFLGVHRMTVSRAVQRLLRRKRNGLGQGSS
jgi:REP element-mobilizing transposase RayT